MPISQKTTDFLAENRLQNSRQWFEEHKHLFYEFVINPLAELVIALTPTMHEIDPKLVCEPKTGKCISRIYRDIRFSKDKSLYRDLMWIVFIREKKLYNGMPGFFIEISPTGFIYGCGYYGASPQTMEGIRKLILNNDSAFKKAADTLKHDKRNVFIIDGEMYKKSKFPDQSEELRSWLDRKNICFIHKSNDMNIMFSQDFYKTIADGYKLLKPVYNFLVKAEESN